MYVSVYTIFVYNAYIDQKNINQTLLVSNTNHGA